MEKNAGTLTFMTLKQIGKVIMQAARQLKQKQPLLLASATAFFTLFSAAPIIIIILNISSLYLQHDVISSEMYQRIQGVFGTGTADQLRDIVDNFRKQASSPWITVAGSVFLAFVATTLLHVVRQALNQIWNIRIKKTRKIKHNLKNRISSFILIVIGGALFSASMFTDAAVALLGKYLDQIVPSVDALVVMGVNQLLSLIIATLWFAILFKYLPSARINGKYAIIGGLFTAILFDAGKFLLGRFLVTDNLNDLFGASASVMLLLLFIFYSSIIMYFGAAFTMMFAREAGHGIRPKKNAEMYEVTAIEH